MQELSARQAVHHAPLARIVPSQELNLLALAVPAPLARTRHLLQLCVLPAILVVGRPQTLKAAPIA
jgi:hypothetical protein